MLTKAPLPISARMPLTSLYLASLISLGPFPEQSQHVLVFSESRLKSSEILLRNFNSTEVCGITFSLCGQQMNLVSYKIKCNVDMLSKSIKKMICKEFL